MGGTSSTLVLLSLLLRLVLLLAHLFLLLGGGLFQLLERHHDLGDGQAAVVVHVRLGKNKQKHVYIESMVREVASDHPLGGAIVKSLKKVDFKLILVKEKNFPEVSVEGLVLYRIINM